MVLKVESDLQCQAIAASNLTLSGDLVVNGTQHTINAESSTFDDSLVKYGDGNSADSLDLGWYGQMNDGTAKYVGLFRDASDSGKFKLFNGLEVEPTTTVNTAGTGYATATLVANLEGNVTGNVTGNVNGVDPSTHASRHETGGSDPINAGNCDTSYSPTNYTAGGGTIDDHLAGIDSELATAGGGGSGTVQSYQTAFGDGAATSYVITHNIGTRNVQVQIWEAGSPYGLVLAEVEATSINTVTVKLASAPSSNSLRCVVMGTPD